MHRILIVDDETVSGFSDSDCVLIDLLSFV